MDRLAELMKCDPKNHEQVNASRALCKGLADVLEVVVSTAISGTGGARDAAAISFLGSFCMYCTTDLLTMVVKRDMAASQELPSIINRFVALTGAPVGSQVHLSARCALRQLVQRLPSSRREVLQRMHSAVTGGDTPETAANSTHALHACISGSDATLSAPISPGAQRTLLPLHRLQRGAGACVMGFQKQAILFQGMFPFLFASNIDG